jgi:FtsX-like permease family protein
MVIPKDTRPVRASPDRRRIALADVRVAVGVGVVQVAGTYFASRHHPGQRAFDAGALALLAAAALALLYRWRAPALVLVLVFGATLSYSLVGYADGPIFLALIVAFFTAIMAGRRRVAWVVLGVGYLGFVWLTYVVGVHPWPPPNSEYASSAAQGVNTVLGVVYALLALAIIIALMGIANTLSLSIHERTRELGLLRAIGQTRSQLRSMVRWEAVLIAAYGAAGGLGVGAFLGWALVKAASASEGTGTFALPVGQLLVVGALGAFAGVLAALRPTRQAAKLPLLHAIATD